MFFNKWRSIFSVMHKAGLGFLCIMTKRFSVKNGIAPLGAFFYALRARRYEKHKRRTEKSGKKRGRRAFLRPRSDLRKIAGII